MTKLPDPVLDLLCREVFPIIRKTGGYSFEDHFDRIDAEFLAAPDKSESGDVFRRYVQDLSALTAAREWIATESALAA